MSRGRTGSGAATDAALGPEAPGGRAVASPSFPARSIEYRADVEGLRGAAIVLVLAFHFDVPWMPGGFIGVDVFYVISGFLIGSLLQALPTHAPGALFDFYARRLKRLMPAYLVLAFALTVVCFAILLPEDLLRFLTSLRETLLFRANRYFERELSSYFAPAARQLPLLHTWSLSIEWQFYLAFPLCLVVAYRVAGARLWPRLVLAAFVVLAGLSCYLVAVEPQAYFRALPRAFEFVGGAAIAAWGTVALPRRRADAVAGVAFVLLVALAATLTPRTPFPGLWAIPVFCLAAAVIVFCRHSAFAGSALATGIGRRSYSLYLWHWPVLAIAAYLQPERSLQWSLALLLAILLLAEISYRAVERPAFVRRMGSLQAALVLWLVPAIVAVALLQVARHWDGFPQRLGADYLNAYTQLRAAERALPRGCDRFSGADDPTRCVLGAVGAKTRALLIGDSHARHFAGFMNVLGVAADVEVVGMFSGECLSLLGASHLRHGTVDAACEASTRAYYEMIRGGAFRYVVLAQRWIGYTEADLANLEPSLAVIAGSGATPVIVRQIAEGGTNMKACFDRHFIARSPYDGSCVLRRDNEFARDRKAEADRAIAAAVAKFPRTIVIDPQRVQCDRMTCRIHDGAVPLYGDLHHLTDFGSALLGREYLERFGSPLR